MKFRSLFIVVLTLATTASCSKDTAATKAAPAEAKSAVDEDHAPSEVTPGTHDDWCGEHEVPESQCTQCNASLIPAFKATNDWCPEHGLPESQCKICNPELVITRPLKGT